MRSNNGTPGATLREFAALLASFHLTAEQLQAVECFKPDIVYCWPGDAPWINLARRMSTNLHVPLVAHFMDDHIAAVESEGVLERVRRKLLARLTSRVVSQASIVMAISDAMAAELRARYCRPVEVFRAGIDTSAWPPPAGSTQAEPNALVYVGSIEGRQLSGVIRIAEAVDLLHREGLPHRFKVHLTDYYRHRVGSYLEGFAATDLLPHPEPTDLPGVLRRAAALVVAYSFDPASIAYYRNSFPTKVGAYMMSGRPILAVGPEQIEPIAYLQRAGSAMIVSEDSAGAVAEAIRRLSSDPEAADLLGQKAYVTAQREHDEQELSRRFASVLADVADRRKR